MKSRKITATAAAVGMLILILDGRTALSGMREGVDLCLRVLIPSLFPFFILSSLLTSTLSGAALPPLRPLGRLLGIPAGCEYLLAIGSLGGYPVGARNVALAHREGYLARADAGRILALCNNAGPSFLFGMLSPLFSSPKTAWVLWGVHLLSAIAAGLTLPGSLGRSAAPKQRQLLTLPQALEGSLRVMGTVCGWVVLFRLVLSFLDRWVLWMLPQPASVLIAGLLELSNGCVRLQGVASEELRFLLASVMLSFGGCCVGLQTVSVSGELPHAPYFLGKLLQTGYSLLLSLALLRSPVYLLPVLTLPLLLRSRRKNRGSISPPVVV